MAMDGQAPIMSQMPYPVTHRCQSSRGYDKISHFWHSAPALCCEALPMDLIIAAAMFHLPCGCMAMDGQAPNMSQMPYPVTHRCQHFWHRAPALCCEALPVDLII